MVTKPTGNPIGRPSKYQTKYCQMLVDHMSDGYSFESFGALIETTRVTLYAWAHKHPEFLYAKEIGNSKSRFWWEKAGRTGMFTKNFSTGTWVFNMKNRWEWTDRVEVAQQKEMSTITIEMPEANKQKVITLDDGKEQK